jgi:hypothetical protein
MAKDLHDLIKRAMDDPRFRQRLLADPEGTVNEDEYNIPLEKLNEIKKFSEAPPGAIDAVIEGIHKGERRAG